MARTLGAAFNAHSGADHTAGLADRLQDSPSAPHEAGNRPVADRDAAFVSNKARQRRGLPALLLSLDGVVLHHNYSRWP